MKFNNLKTLKHSSLKIKNLNFNIIVALFFMTFLINGCYNDMVEATDEYAIQVPFNYVSKKNAFTTRFDDTIFYNIDKFLNYSDGDKIYNLDEFKDNKNLITRLEIYQMYVFIDSISAFDPNDNEPETFATVQSYIKFKGDSESYRIQYMENVKLREFYRQSPDYKPRITTIDKETSDAISAKFMKETPFQIFSYFTSYVGKRDKVDRLDFNIAASLRITLDNGKEEDHSDH